MNLKRVIHSNFNRVYSEYSRKRLLGKLNRDPSYTNVFKTSEKPILLVRILGNDLYPRHQAGQTPNNLDFILKNEPEFDNVRKLFVINRIFNSNKQRLLEEAVKDHGYETLVVPFDPSSYAEVRFDIDRLGGLAHFTSSEFRSLSEHQSQNLRILASAPKIRYAMNVNGARNAALEFGRKLGGWTLPLDGNCFLNEASFEAICEDLIKPPHAPYIILPMQRLQRFDDVQRPQDMSRATEEPQVAVHVSANEMFDTWYPYGLMSKTSYFETLGVPGPWDYWKRNQWFPEVKPRSVDWKRFKTATAQVFRLPSDDRGGELEKAEKQIKRFESRNIAILGTIAILDRMHGSKDVKFHPEILGEEILRMIEDQL